MRVYVFFASQWVPADLETTFAFFSDAGNLEALTPPLLRFRIRTPLPIEMRQGALIDYDLRLHGLPVRWRTRIDRWERGRAFEDRQLSGPYAHWVHLHTFEAAAGGTRLCDRVEYSLPFEPFSYPAHRLYVLPTIERIFAYRRQVIAARFGGDGRETPPGEARAR
jgi:ligand-binding SRPBCC domain-containing protein